MSTSNLRADLEVASVARVGSLLELLHVGLGDARVCIQELHVACRDRDSARMASLVRRLQKAWTRGMTVILVIEQITERPNQEARNLLHQSEMDAAPLLAHAAIKEAI